MPQFQDTKLITLAVGATEVYTLPAHAVLDKLTIWAVGPVPGNNIAVQPRVNDQAYGGVVNILAAGGPIHQILWQANDGANGDRLIPAQVPAARRAVGVPNFVFSLAITAGITGETLTIYAVANELTMGA